MQGSDSGLCPLEFGFRVLFLGLGSRVLGRGLISSIKDPPGQVETASDSHFFAIFARDREQIESLKDFYLKINP